MDRLVELPHGGLAKVWVMLFEVIADILQIRCSGGVQRMRIYKPNISSKRASLASSSMNSPRFAWARYLSAQQHESGCSLDANAMRLLSPDALGLSLRWWRFSSCASCSGAKYISVAFRLRKTSRAATLIHGYSYHDNNIEVGSGRP
jgi:hypothetical protein